MMANHRDEERHLSGVKAAETINRVDSPFLAAKGNIAAIDFGTSNCSLAYCKTEDEEMTLLRLESVENKVRIPTILLVDKDWKPIYFGERAIIEYDSLLEKDVKCHLFERVKLALGPDEVRLYIYI